MKRKPLLMKTKLEILDEYKKGSKLSDIARRRGLNASTVHYIINQVIYIAQFNNLGCVFPMAIVSILPPAEFGWNDHQEDALHFKI